MPQGETSYLTCGTSLHYTATQLFELWSQLYTLYAAQLFDLWSQPASYSFLLIELKFSIHVNNSSVVLRPLTGYPAITLGVAMV